MGLLSCLSIFIFILFVFIYYSFPLTFYSCQLAPRMRASKHPWGVSSLTSLSTIPALYIRNFFEQGFFQCTGHR